MKTPLLSLLLLAPGLIAGAAETAPVPPSASLPAATLMSRTITGKFDVKMTPQTPDSALGGTKPGRFLLEKTYHGELAATAVGEMLAVGTAVRGSAGYVALETVQGTLAGRTGTFVLQHHGLMDRGQPQLSVTVVPDSGTADLAGLAGTMTIQITAEGHFYTFTYRLPSP